MRLEELTLELLSGQEDAWSVMHKVVAELVPLLDNPAGDSLVARDSLTYEKEAGVGSMLCQYIEDGRSEGGMWGVIYGERDEPLVDRCTVQYVRVSPSEPPDYRPGTYECERAKDT